MKQIKVGIAGNPNCGKTTIFNSMTGSHQKVGNYAGVTVEKKEGKRIYRDYEFIIYDLPGTYSLTAYSIDEVVARDFIIDEKPDIIIDVIDSTNIERNLYLCLQFQELKIRIVCALNIADQAEEMGIKIDEKQLSKILDIPMIKTVGLKDKGITLLLDAVIDIIENNKTQDKIPSYGYEIELEIEKITGILELDRDFSMLYPVRWIAIKLLEKDKNVFKKIETHKHSGSIKKTADQSIKKIESHFGRDSEIVISEQRYAYIHGTVAETVKKSSTEISKTEKIDNILLNRFLGLPIFLFIIWSIFQLTFALGAYPQAWLETFFGWLSDIAKTAIPPGMLQSLVVDGIISGLGGVLSFVPLIVLLFMFISILEDTGYMARAAFIVDKFLHIFGLHGQSFLPMMIGFGCSVPAIMAARTLKSRKDRIVTILVTPFMNCGAKLPVHILLAGAFFPKNSGNMVLLIYIIGILLALLSSLLFRKTVLRGESTPFVLELPPYRLPTVIGILWHIWDKTIGYLKKAGVILFPASVLIWLIISFPQPAIDQVKFRWLDAKYRNENVPLIQEKITSYINDKSKIELISDSQERKNYKDIVSRIQTGNSTVLIESEQIAAVLAEQYIINLMKEEQLSYSFAGRLGRFIEPVVAPLGFDWKIGIATVTGFAAKEVVVSTLGILYRAGDQSGDKNETLRHALQNDKRFNPLVAFVFMLFTLIFAPCFAAQAAIKAELGWKWLGFYLFYSIAASWSICFAVYQSGKLLGLGV